MMLQTHLIRLNTTGGKIGGEWPVNFSYIQKDKFSWLLKMKKSISLTSNSGQQNQRVKENWAL